MRTLLEGAKSSAIAPSRFPRLPENLPVTFLLSPSEGCSALLPGFAPKPV